jgi:LysR family transcriptional regulator for bpeEF and oprC
MIDMRETVERMAYQSPPLAAHLEELCAFVNVVEANGFSAAARLTGGRKATLSQRVQALEARLGLPLLVRTTRSLHLTDEGRAYYEHARRSLRAAHDAEAIVLSAKSEPSGRLRVTTTIGLSTLLEQVVLYYLVRYPQVAVDLDTSAGRSEPLRAGFDVAVRTGKLEDSALLSRKLGPLHTGYVLSPGYLARRGAPSHPDQLLRHEAIVHPGRGPTAWQFSVGGKTRSYPVRARLTVESIGFALQAALDGYGIACVPLHAAERYLTRRNLITVLREFDLPPVAVHAVFPATGALLPKTRTFVDVLARYFAEHVSGAAAQHVR